MKLCPKCEKYEIDTEEELCLYCRLEEKRKKDMERAQVLAEETRRKRQVRNRIMGNNQRRH